jgi:outer membrane receptor protein involved in Fe transport
MQGTRARLRTTGLVGASTIAITSAMAQGALAQTTAAPGNLSAELGEIVVTATRRAESLSKVPISVSAYTNETLERRGVRDVRDVIQLTPGVDIPRSGRAQVTVRGINSNAGSPTTAIYIDDTPVHTRNASILYNGSTVPYVFDLERVEVLRGPQGTLFGASAQGGAIRLITPDPSLTEFSGFARAGVEKVQYGGVGYQGGVAMGGPIIPDQLGFRVSAFYRKEAGWIDRQSWQNPDNGGSNVNRTTTFIARAALLWEPTDWLRVAPSVYLSERLYNDRQDNWTRCPDTFPSHSGNFVVPCPLGVSDPEDGKFVNYTSVREWSKDRFILPSLKVEADGGPVVLTSVTSWFARNILEVDDQTNLNDRTGFGVNYTFPVTPGFAESIIFRNPHGEQKALTQELRLASADSDARLRWTTGLYFSRTSLSTHMPIYEAHYNALYQVRFGRPAPADRPMVGPNRYLGLEWTVEKSLAAFASVDLEVIDNLTVSFGGRISKDQIDYDISTRGVTFANGIQTVSGSHQEKPFIPRVAISYQATPTALYYASYAEGYRTGGVNRALPDICEAEAAALGIGDAAIYDADRTKSFEVGTKNRVMGGRLQYDISAFHTKWTDIQRSIGLTCNYTSIANLKSATAKGFDATVNFEPMDNLFLALGVGYVDATQDQTIVIGVAPIAIKGQSLGATPWTVNASAQYTIPMGENQAYVFAQYIYRGVDKGPFLYNSPQATTYDPTRVIPASIHQLDIRAGYKWGAHEAVAYIENALNYVEYISEAPLYARAPVWMGETLRPRTFGLQLTTRF